MTAQEMREAREKALMKAFEKSVSTVYEGLFNGEMTLKMARYHIDNMEGLLGEEDREIAKAYGFDPDDD